jgi:probable rRNA maturation factor
MTPAPSRPAPSIDIQIQSPLWEAEPAAGQTARDAIAMAAATLSTAGNEVAILLTDDETIRGLNRRWRGIDKPTNVLSFPATVTVASLAAKFSGDIVIAYETLKRECNDEGRIFLHHLAHLVVHGFLHLIGYSHDIDAEAEKMEGLESKIMMRMNLPDPWHGSHLDREFGDA